MYGPERRDDRVDGGNSMEDWGDNRGLRR